MDVFVKMIDNALLFFIIIGFAYEDKRLFPVWHKKMNFSSCISRQVEKSLLFNLFFYQKDTKVKPEETPMSKV